MRSVNPRPLTGIKVTEIAGDVTGEAEFKTLAGRKEAEDMIDAAYIVCFEPRASRGSPSVAGALPATTSPKRESLGTRGK